MNHQTVRCILASLLAAAATAGRIWAQPSEPVQLSPYEVKVDSDTSYGATNSAAVTRFNAELNKLPLSADIYDQAFMQDTASTSVETMIQTYSAGAGFSAGDPGGAGATGGSTAQPGDHVSHGYTELRGFDTPRPERDSLMPVGSLFNPGSTAPNYTSNFDVERVEVIDGPQALLYSGGGAGGVINVTSKQARIGQPAFGSAQFQVDQYGSKRAVADFGASSSAAAVRFATIDETQDTRRLFIGSSLKGYYGQIAFKVFGNTTIRLEGEQTTDTGTVGNVTDILSGSTAADSRDDDQLRYLLAANLAGSVNPATGQPFGPAANAIDNGLLNWSNVDSQIGWQASQSMVDTFETLTAETQWAPWLSTEFAVGYNTVKYDLVLPIVLDYFAPEDTAASNPNPLAAWAIADQPGDQEEDGRTKGIRFAALLTQDWLDGTAHSQTNVGADFVRSDAMDVEYSYYQADSNFNVIVNPATLATNDGRTIIPKQYWSIAQGPVEYPLFSPAASRVTLGGVNYVRQIQNEVNPALISPANPLGLTNSDTYEVAKLINQGIFLVNYTQWLNGRLATMAGVRFAHSDDEGLILSGPLDAKSNTANYDVGVNYALTSWLRPYVSASSSYEPPQTVGNHDPYGQVPTSGRSTGQEVGLKFANPGNSLSGSLAFFHTNSKNEQYEISSTLVNDINPTGLNGVGVSGQWVDLNRTTNGLQFLMTANPTPNWRMRLSAADTDGKILNNKQYAQLYNDQFYENGAGQVTYADGSVVYVNPTFNSKTPVATSTTAGAIPLTVALMNNASSPYYANPVNPTGAINATSNVATVLKTVDPVHGSILTGKLGLPISALQITPSFTVPGTIPVALAGDQTLGYPQYSFNFTNVYTFKSGWIRGFELGGTASASWKYGRYYYYPAGITAASQQRQIFTAPNSGRIDLIAGYSHKFGRVVWRTQLNINNLFNHYQVTILPNEITGYTVAANLNATFTGQPRAWVWSNTINF